MATSWYSPRRAALLLLALIATLAFQPAPQPIAAQASCAARAPGLQHGLNVFFFGTDQQRVLDLTSTAGFGWVRQQIHWRDIETVPGQYDWSVLDGAVDNAAAHGLRVLLSIVRSPAWVTTNGAGGLPDDPSAMQPFLAALATRYAGRVAAYEVWNEPNLAVENGGTVASPAQYLALLEASYATLKAADPCALVLAAPLAPTIDTDPAIATDDLAFYDALYAAPGEAFLRAADAVALHTGTGEAPFDAAWPTESPALSRRYFRHVEQVRARMEQHGDQRLAWITEVGWTVAATPGGPAAVAPEQQAENLAGALHLISERYPWVAGVFVWNLNFGVLGPPEDEKSGFGILDADWSPRPAYLLVQSYLQAYADEQRLLLPRTESPDGPQYTWHARLPGRIRVAPSLGADGTAYAVSRFGYLYAVATNGHLRWRYDAPDAVRAVPAQGADGTLYLGDDGGHLTALGPDGRVRWQLDTGGAVRGSPLVAPDAVLFTNYSGEALRVALDGTLLWRVSLSSTATAPAALAADGTLFVPTSSGDMVALERDGRERWRTALGRRVTTAPVVAGSALLIADTGGRLSSLDAATGSVQWQQAVAAPTDDDGDDEPLFPRTPALSPDSTTVYLGAGDGSLHALATDGTPRWRLDVPQGIDVGPIVGIDGTVYIGVDEELLAIDPAGQQRWQVAFQGTVLGVRPPSGTEPLYVGTSRDLLYALNIADSR